MSRPILPAGVAAAALALLLGCDSQTDGGYPGEPLVTLHGRVESTGPLPPLEAAMLWQRAPPPAVDDQELATRAPVQSGFPATFTLRLFHPPPAEAVRTLAPREVSWARASRGGSVRGGGGGVPCSRRGQPQLHLRRCALGDPPPGRRPAQLAHPPGGCGSLGRGYHLLKVLPVQCPTPDQLVACVAELVQRGVVDDGTSGPGTARGYCLAPYRLQPTTLDEAIVLQLGPLPVVGGPACP
jgi:hypothetical protein